MIAILLNSLLLTVVRTRIVYIKTILDVDGKGVNCPSHMAFEKDIAELITRNFVANYCKGDKFESVVSEIYDTFMDKQTDPSQCFDKFKTRLTEFVCETKNDYHIKQNMGRYLEWDGMIEFCIEQRNVLRSLACDSKDYDQYQTFMKFYISSLCKYGVYKSVIDPFLMISGNQLQPIFQEYSNYVSGFSQYVDLKYIKLLDEIKSNNDVTYIPYNIHNFSHYGDMRSYITTKINELPSDDKTYIVCALDILKIMYEIKRHYNKTHEIDDAEKNVTPTVLRFGSKILKDANMIANKEENIRICSSCKLENLYVLPERELAAVMYVDCLKKPDHANILEFYEAYAEFNMSLEEFFDGKYQHFQCQLN